MPGAIAHEFAPTERISTYITTILAGPYTKVCDEWQGVDVQGETQTVPWRSTAGERSPSTWIPTSSSP